MKWNNQNPAARLIPTKIQGSMARIMYQDNRRNGMAIRIAKVIPNTVKSILQSTIPTLFRKVLIAFSLTFYMGPLAHGACDPTLQPTYTSRAGIPKPAINSCGWGLVTNSNWDIVDSSMCVPSKSNNFTSTNFFNGIVSSGTAKFYGNPAIEVMNNSRLFLESSVGDVSYLEQNCVGAACLEITNGVSPFGIGINNSYGSGGSNYSDADLVICSRSAGCGGLGNYGTFALVGAMSNGSAAYSGFTATGPITSSTLWSLPKADGFNGQALTTDGQAHLSFTTIAGGGGGGGGSGSVVASNQFQVPFFSVAGSSNVVTGAANLTNNSATVNITQSNTGAVNGLVLTSTGTGIPFQMNVNGRPSGGEQNQIGGMTINGPNYPSDSGFSPALLVLADSTTNSTNGAGLMEIWEQNPNHNSYLLWIHGSSPRNSDEPIRFDGPTLGIDEVVTSTDNAHGLGKWKVLSAGLNTSFSQIVSPRSWDNSTFENLAYAVPFTQPWLQPAGVYLRAQSLTNDSAVISSSDTSVFGWNTQNNHIVGITSPLNPTASYQFALPSTFNNLGQVLYQSDNGRGNNNNARSWNFTTGGSTGQFLTFNSGSAPTWTSGGGFLSSTQTWTGQNNWVTPAQSTFTFGVTVGSMTVNGPGNGVIGLTISGSTYTVTSSSVVPVVGHCVAWGSTNYNLIDTGSACGAGGGGGSVTLVATQTWTGQNNWTTPLPSTFTFGVVADTMSLRTSGGIGGELTLWNSGGNNRQIEFDTDSGAFMGQINLLSSGYFRIDDETLGPLSFQTGGVEAMRLDYASGGLVVASSETVNGTGGLTVTTGPINTNSFYQINGSPFLSGGVSAVQSVFVGDAIGTASSASSDVCIGFNSCNAIVNASNNTIVGHQAGATLSSGQHNTCIGHFACNAVGATLHNTAMGSNALGGASLSGNDNIGIGYLAGDAITSGAANTVISGNGVNNLTTGNFNTILSNGGGVTTGNANVMIGGGSAVVSNEITTGSSNTIVGGGDTGGAGNANNQAVTYLGFDADAGTASQLFNATAIGYKASVLSSNTIQMGGTGANAAVVSGTTLLFAGPTPSTFTFGVVASSYNVRAGVGNNTGILFQNGSQYTNSSTFQWNGTTMTATAINVIGTSATNAYEFRSSTSATGPYSLVITTTNHIDSGVSASTSTCGTGAGFTGTDFSGFITPGTAAGGCTVTFATPYTNPPTCTVSERTMSLVNALSYTVSTTALTITQTSLTSILDYICTGLKE